MVPPDSPRVSRVRGYSGIPLADSSFRVRGYHPVSRSFPTASTSLCQYRCVAPTTPPQKGMVWAIPRSLAATDGVSFDFLSYGYLDVSVPRVGFPFGMTLACRVSPFGHPRFIACLPAHRGFSQAPTSFIASYCQGIHLMPLVAFSTEIVCALVTRLRWPKPTHESTIHYPKYICKLSKNIRESLSENQIETTVETRRITLDASRPRPQI